MGKEAGTAIVVLSERAGAAGARTLARRLGVPARVLAVTHMARGLGAHDACLFRLGEEDQPRRAEPALRRLKALARRRAWGGRFVLLCEGVRPERAVECGRLVERLLPTRSMVCFDAAGVVAALNLPVPASAKQADREMTEAVDVVALRKTLGLTQEETALAAGVSTRTVQNWETDRPSPAATRRLRDLRDLARTLGDYMSAADIPKWLRSPNETFRGSAPIALLAEGRTRDVLIEFRRMEMGEPG